MPGQVDQRSSTPGLAPDHRIAVIGAGVTGIATAALLADRGYTPVVFEASGRIGGQVRSVNVTAGVAVELGAEAIFAAAGMPQLFTACSNDIVRARRLRTWIGVPTGTGSSGWIPPGEIAGQPAVTLRRLPHGVTPAGPTRLLPVASSRILSPTGLLRAATELVRTRSHITDQTSVGQLVTERFGRQLAQRIVDPLLGNLHGADIFRLEARSCAPQLVDQLTANRSVLAATLRRSRRRPSPVHPGSAADVPGFATAVSGLQRVIEQLAGGTDVRLGQPVQAIVKTAGGSYQIVGPTGAPTSTPHSATETFAAVVIATGAASAARMLADVTDIPTTLGRCPTSSVTCVVVAYPQAAVESLSAFDASGIMLPSNFGGMLKSATFLSAKWPHLDLPPQFLVRMSTGRFGDTRANDLSDAEVTDRLHGELSAITGLRATPEQVAVHRWTHTLPVNEIGHSQRIQAARNSLGVHRPGVVLAGAAFDGPGLANCLRSAERAVLQVIDHLGDRTPHA
ncbi:MAG: protoporphyrinogen oxidase [Nitriliruptoraceae bacterium]